MPARNDLTVGRQVRQPDRFTPTTTWTDDRYLYRYDEAAGIVKRTPISVGAAGGSGYYMMYASGTVPQPLTPRAIVKAPTRQPITSISDLPPTPEQVLARNAHRANKKVVLPGERPRWVKVLSSALATVFVAAASILAYPFIPAAQYQLGHHTTNPTQQIAAVQAAAVSPENRVIIPKIGVNTNIVEGPSLDVLNQYDGVWHETGDPGKGNFVLAGHRFKYLPPNTNTLYNLDKLTPGDVIVIDWRGQRTLYTVSALATVPATQVSILNQTTHPRLTIYSCSDKEMDGRVVATAEPLTQ